jgi:hypothetical protein
MYFWTQEIETINDNTITLKNWVTVEIEEKNKKLFTEEPITGSELQVKMNNIIATEIVDVLFSNNARLVDINQILWAVNEIVTSKQEEAIVDKFWKEKLDAISEIFWANEKIASLSVRSIRIKDIFNT